MNEEKIKNCLQEDPNMALDIIAKKTGIDLNEVTAIVCNLAIQADKKQAQSGIPVPAGGLDIMSILSDDPFHRFDDTLSAQIDDILSDNKKSFDKRFQLVKPIMLNKIYHELERDKQSAENRLKQCTRPTQGARWLELKIKAQAEQMKILGLEPDKNNNINVTIGRSKEELDKIYEAAKMDQYGNT